jgi:predicted small lipoprotein YifL
MKKILFLTLALFVFSCSKGKDDPLILPPNFADAPDPNKPEEQPSEKQREENVAKLKELLLKSEE